MLRFRERLTEGSLPAFNLELVQQHTELVLEDELGEASNAATCAPISRINDRLFIGTWRDAVNGDLLYRLRITHVLNVARELADDESQGVESGAFATTKCIPLSDSLNEDIRHHLEEAINFIGEATRHGCVLVYCRRGISRSAAIVIAYMMASEGMSFPAAYRNVQLKRPCISLNLAFMQRLEEYEGRLSGMRVTRCGLASARTTSPTGETGESPVEGAEGTIVAREGRQLLQ
uniref:protein-tyrosine-phosphatase n=1 Tax=Trypanosoma congolense (strain IL3000) TaxID=1068625 RepID=G0UXK3_TRYCI|nr:putative map kinase phosphatase [Trypanosoma congolense IL3000]